MWLFVSVVYVEKHKEKKGVRCFNIKYHLSDALFLGVSMVINCFEFATKPTGYHTF